MSYSKMLTRFRRAKKVSIIPTVCIVVGVILLAFKHDGANWLLHKTGLRRTPLQLTDDKRMKYHGHDFLKDPPFIFDQRFKNPCWFEEGTLNCLPYFFIMGMRKSGTTSLYSALVTHPEVFNWGSKESQFFGYRQYRRESGSDDIRNYVKMFSKGAKQIQLTTNPKKPDDINKHILGDGSVCTLHVNYDWRQFPGNENLTEPKVLSLDYLHHFLPNAKIILIFRDPVDSFHMEEKCLTLCKGMVGRCQGAGQGHRRWCPFAVTWSFPVTWMAEAQQERLYSEYYFSFGKLNKIYDLSPRTFHDFVTDLIEVFSYCCKKRRVRECVYDGKLFGPRTKSVYIEMGIYYIYWMELLRLYRRDQILVLHMTELGNLSVIRKVFSFLGIGQLSDEYLKKMWPTGMANTRLEHYAQQGPMWNSTRKLLNDFYRPFNQHMADLLNDPYFLFET